MRSGKGVAEDYSIHEAKSWPVAVEIPPRVKSCGRSRGKTLLIRVHLRRGEGRVSTLGLHVVLHNLIAQDLD